ncbi:MAG: radical SAM protein [Thermodesulfobacteriota bacterium]
MKIALVCPSWTDDLGIFTKIAKRRNSQPPLGILYLAAVAEKLGHSVALIDADVEDHTLESLIAHLLDGGYDLLGITATSPIFHKAVALAQGLKGRGFKPPIVIGGEHINIFKSAAFFPCFDYAFYGESDLSFAEFLQTLEREPRQFSGIRGMIFRDNEQVVENPPTERIKNLDELCLPAMHLLRRDRYIMTFAKFKSRVYLPIMATRGCPFKCAFCSEPLTNPYVRFRSAKNIVDEIEKWVNELNITHFFFMDSNLTLNKNQVQKVCQEILDRKLKITFEGWTRANLVNREILTLLKSAGLIRMSYGIESGDPEVLKIIRKEVSHEDMLNAFAMTEELGIEPACSVMLGLPGDTRRSVERTIEFVRKIPQILYSNFSIANPYPGTQLYDWAREGKHGLRLEIRDFSDYRRYDHSPISVNDLSQKDLVRMQRVGLLRIHLTPKRIWAAIRMVGFAEMLAVGLRLLGTAVASVFSQKRITQPPTSKGPVFPGQ